MIKYFLTLFLCSSFFVSQAQLNSKLDSLSYAIGVNIGESFSGQGLNPNVDIVAKAIKDVLAGQNTLIESQACMAYIQNYMQQVYQDKANNNLAAGEAFLAENKTKDGVQTTASGLQYKVLNAGTGAKPTTADRVKVHYHGTLIDGTVFDSSVDRGTPATFGVTQVIKGWIEGLQLMNEGSKYRFFIPSNLAYGPQASPKIGPNQVLVFDVELIQIVKEG